MMACEAEEKVRFQQKDTGPRILLEGGGRARISICD
jgi:hypothetical protein